MALKKKALATFATGLYAELLDISRPTFVHYAERHGYEYVETLPGDIDRSRPPSWWRIPALQELLDRYESVLWLGSDVVIVDSSQDIAGGIENGAWQSMVVHRSPQGDIPNCDVWFVRPGMQPWLGRAWELSQYTDHPWWEQAAILHLMGYAPSHYPVERVRDSKLFDATCFLSLEWNSHESFDRAREPRFAHATHGNVNWRKQVMLNYRQQADCP